MDDKRCTKCQTEKPVNEFPKGKNYEGGLHPWCKQCHNDYQKERSSRLSPSQKRKRDKRNREWVAQRVAEGFCARCYVNKHKRGRKLCADCLKSRVEEVRRNYLKRIAGGMCGRCGKNPLSEGSDSRCASCLKSSVSSAMNLRRQRFSSGVCERCGRNPVKDAHYCAECIATRSAWKKPWWRKLKLEAFDSYGGRICACCGESNELFLTLDHVNNDGAKHRSSIFKRRTGTLWLWLRKHGYPSGFQVLCMNCNFGKHWNGGICPHKAEPKGES